MKKSDRTGVLIILFLLLVITDIVTCNFRFLLLHTNDMHSRYKEVNIHTNRCQESSNKCYGGFARVRAAVKRFTEDAEKKGMPTLYLDAGNVFQGTVYYTEFKWELAVKMMNLLKPRAMSLGNHEFDDGIEGLAPFVQRLNVPILCSNIDISQEPRLKVNGQINPSMVVTLGKAKIGIVGYLSQEISEEKLGNVKVLDEIASLQTETKRLRDEENVDIIIALGHSGYEMDKKIAMAVENIDVIVGGDYNTFLYRGKPPSDNKVTGPYPTIIYPETNMEKEIPIVHASYGTKYLGYLELEFDDNWNLIRYEGLPVLLNGEMEQDREVLEALKPESDIIAAKYEAILGHTEFTLEGRFQYCRFVECNIGNMIADAFVDHVKTNYQTDNGKKVKIGLVPARAIKGSLFGETEEGYTGEIILQDVLAVLPSGCSLEVLGMKGSDLKSLLESTMDKFEPDKGSAGLLKADLLQVSGIKVKYDLRKEKGQRLESVKVKRRLRHFTDLHDDRVYNVVMPDCLAQGNDYNILAQQTRVAALDKNEKDYMVVENFIKKEKVFKKGGTYSMDEDRISIKLPRMSLHDKLSNYLATLNPYNGLRG